MYSPKIHISYMATPDLHGGHIWSKEIIKVKWVKWDPDLTEFIYLQNNAQELSLSLFLSLSSHSVCMQGHVRTQWEVTICKPGRGFSPETEPCLNCDLQLSSLQNQEKINLCCLRQPVCGVLLWQHEQTKTIINHDK